MRASINAIATLPKEISLMSFMAVTATKIEQNKTNASLIPLCQYHRVNTIIVIRYTIILTVKPKHRILPRVSLVI